MKNRVLRVAATLPGIGLAAVPALALERSAAPERCRWVLGRLLVYARRRG